MYTPFFRRWFPNDEDAYAGFLEAVTRRVPPVGKVLDLGCGRHTQLAHLANPDLEIWGTDFQEHPEQANRDFFRLLGPGGVIPFADEFFDLVTTNMVLEHVVNPEAFRAEVHRVLKPGGYFVGNTICSLHYVTWLRRAVGLLPHAFNQWLVRKLYGREECDTFPTYYRMNTPAKLARQFSGLGYELVEVKRYANANYFCFSPFLHRMAVLADAMCEKIHAGLGRLYFTAVLRKPPAPAQAKLAA
jgi:SAM-dependent methyltransferase